MMKWRKLLKRTKVDSNANTLNELWGLKKTKFGTLGGDNVRLSAKCFWGNAQNIYIEDNVFIGREAYLDAVLCSITIREGTMIGPRVTMIAGNHNYRSEDLRTIPYDNRILDTPIVIGRNVWIGADVMICPGTTIGEGVIIGAGCSVHGDIPPYSIVVPANYRIIGTRDVDQYTALDKADAIYNKRFAGQPFEQIKRR